MGLKDYLKLVEVLHQILQPLYRSPPRAIPPLLKLPTIYLDTMMCTIRYKIWYSTTLAVAKHCFHGAAPIGLFV
jgi:hypothetical protein